MRWRNVFASALLSTQLALGFVASEAHSPPAQSASSSPVYMRVPASWLISLLPPPPSQNSPVTNGEIQLLHGLQLNSRPSQKAAAIADSHELDIFVYRTVLGDRFSAEALPLTRALSDQLHRDSDYWNGILKNIYQRPRPYRYDLSLHPLCGRDNAFSYPSGHAMTGYLEAMTLAEIVPEQRDAIFARADDYARNRWVCGAHYPSDTAMAHQMAATLFGIALANPDFTKKLTPARKETRHFLGLSDQPDVR